MTYDIITSIQIIPSLPENFAWNFVERKYKIQWFEGNLSPMSSESVSENDEEEEISDT